MRWSSLPPPSQVTFWPNGGWLELPSEIGCSSCITYIQMTRKECPTPPKICANPMQSWRGFHNCSLTQEVLQTGSHLSPDLCNLKNARFFKPMLWLSAFLSLNKSPSLNTFRSSVSMATPSCVLCRVWVYKYMLDLHLRYVGLTKSACGNKREDVALKSRVGAAGFVMCFLAFTWPRTRGICLCLSEASICFATWQEAAFPEHLYYVQYWGWSPLEKYSFAIGSQCCIPLSVMCNLIHTYPIDPMGRVTGSHFFPRHVLFF